jgi:hypothetical protein
MFRGLWAHTEQYRPRSYIWLKCDYHLVRLIWVCGLFGMQPLLREYSIISRIALVHFEGLPLFARKTTMRGPCIGAFRW